VRFDRIVNDLLVRLFWIERRIDPYLRPAIDLLVRPPLQALVQWIARHRLPDHGLAVAEEQLLPDERDRLNDDALPRAHLP